MNYPEEIESVHIRTSVLDGECYAHVGDLVEWLRAPGMRDSTPDRAGFFLSEAEKLWQIELHEEE